MRRPNLLLLLGSLLFSVCLQAQTKWIAHKSHSGSAASFAFVLEADEDFDGGFGVAPERTVKNAALDSLIFLSDSVVVMVTSDYCKRLGRATPKTTRWRSGKDTILNHFVFNKKNSVESMKSYLRQSYYFENPVDSVRFIFNEQEQEQQYQALPPAGPGDEGPRNDSPLVPLLVIALFSILGGGILWYIQKIRARSLQVAS